MLKICCNHFWSMNVPLGSQTYTVALNYVKVELESRKSVVLGRFVRSVHVTKEISWRPLLLYCILFHEIRDGKWYIPLFVWLNFLYFLHAFVHLELYRNLNLNKVVVTFFSSQFMRSCRLFYFRLFDTSSASVIPVFLISGDGEL